MIAPNQILQEVAVKQLKLRDVNKLLNTHYGDNWRNQDTLQYFARVVPQFMLAENNEDCEDNDIPDETLCELQEEMPSLIV